MNVKRAMLVLLCLCLVLGCLTGCHKHDWQDATCTEPQTCSICGKTEGEALGHEWGEATCTEPEICAVCGATRGNELGHEPTEATCTEPSVCTVCGETLEEALGHVLSKPTHLVPPTCEVCGAVEGSVIPYAEEFGLTFTTGRDYTAPMYAYLSYGEPIDESETMREVEGYITTAEDAVYHLEDVTVSAPDAKGNVTVTIPFLLDCKVRVEYDGVKKGGTFYSWWQFSGFGLFDYYTGNTLPMESNSVGDDAVTVDTTLEYGGETMTLSYTKASESVYSDSTPWEYLSNGGSAMSFVSEYRYTMTVTMPQDYDGLCLYMGKEGHTEWSDFDEKNADMKSEPLLESLDEGHTADDLFIIRVKDLIG